MLSFLLTLHWSWDASCTGSGHFRDFSALRLGLPNRQRQAIDRQVATKLGRRSPPLVKRKLTVSMWLPPENETGFPGSVVHLVKEPNDMRITFAWTNKGYEWVPLPESRYSSSPRRLILRFTAPRPLSLSLNHAFRLSCKVPIQVLFLVVKLERDC